MLGSGWGDKILVAVKSDRQMKRYFDESLLPPRGDARLLQNELREVSWVVNEMKLQRSKA